LWSRVHCTLLVGLDPVPVEFLLDSTDARRPHSLHMARLHRFLGQGCIHQFHIGHH